MLHKDVCNQYANAAFIAQSMIGPVQNFPEGKIYFVLMEID